MPIIFVFIQDLNSFMKITLNGDSKFAPAAYRKGSESGSINSSGGKRPIVKKCMVVVGNTTRQRQGGRAKFQIMNGR